MRSVASGYVKIDFPHKAMDKDITDISLFRMYAVFSDLTTT
jgi:hypothetical protein